MSNRFKSRYDDDINLFEGRWHLAQYALLVALLLAAPWLLGVYYLGELTAVLIWSLAGLGLMLISGHTGQVSLGHAAFMAIGAFTNLALMMRGWHFIPALLASAVTSGVLGAIISRPILRMSGIYLAIATLALSIIIEDVSIIAEPITGGRRLRSITVRSAAEISHRRSLASFRNRFLVWAPGRPALIASFLVSSLSSTRG